MKKLLMYAVVTIIIVLFNSSCKKDSNNPIAPTVFTVTETATTVTYAGKTYHKVTIGSHVWLKENLNVGTMINGSQDASNNGTIEKYCYNDDTANCTTYGDYINGMKQCSMLPHLEPKEYVQQAGIYQRTENCKR